MESRFNVNRVTLLLALSICMHTCRSARILIVPNQSLSHTLYFAHVSAELIQHGHEIAGLMNAACVNSVATLNKAGVRVIMYETLEKTCYTEEAYSFNNAIFNKGTLQSPHITLIKQSNTFIADTDAIFSSKKLAEDVIGSQFDLCIVDGFVLTLSNYIIPYKFGIPYITLTTSFLPLTMGIPGLPSFSPILISRYSDKMSFRERLKNMIDHITIPRFIFSLNGNQDNLVEKYAPERPKVSVIELMKRSQLFLVNTDPVLDYARASLPHVIPIGGVSTFPAKPLPEDLQTLMDSASSQGIVLASFGSIVKHLPDTIFEKLLGTFAHFKEVLFVIRYKGKTLNNIPSNVHLLKWLPQNDMLAHPKVKLFITHCGNNGQFEALYHGVPMIGMPLFGDQEYNAHRMTVKGFGIAMDTFTCNIDELVININRVLTNDSYKNAIEKASIIYRNQFHNARERAVYWIEHIITYGSEHLRSHAIDLPWYQFLMLDLLAFMLTIVALIGIISCVVLKACYGLVRPNSNKIKKN